MTSRNDYDYVIVGGGMVADSAARGIREIDPSGSIGIVAEEKDPPVARPALSKELWTDPDLTFDDALLDTEKDTGAVRHAGRRATAINRESKAVRADDGSTYGYGTLLLATGGRPHRLDLPDSDRVIFFRSAEDYRRLRRLAGNGLHIVVIGGSFIGTELAAALSDTDTHVTLVFPEETLGGSVFPDGLARSFQELYERAGVELVSQATLTRGTERGNVIDLLLSTGEHLEADAVVVGLGVDPNTDLASAAGLTVDDGVVVDDRLRTSDPAIFAAGDIASYPDVILGRTRIEHVDNATEMGKHAGRNLAGADEPYRHTPYFYSVVFENGYEAVGTLDASLSTVEDWDERHHKGVVYYVNADRVVGVLLWNLQGRRDAARDVIRDTHDTRPEKLRGTIPTSDAG